MPIIKSLSLLFRIIFLAIFLVPSSAPPNLRVNDTTSTSILVTWSEVPVEDRNGIIISYNVSYQAMVDGSSTFTKQISAPALQANLTGLIKDTSYSISVLASTIEGDGSYSNATIVQTNQDSKSLFCCP